MRLIVVPTLESVIEVNRIVCSDGGNPHQCFEERGLAIFMEVIIKATEKTLLARLVGKFIDADPTIKALAGR